MSGGKVHDRRRFRIGFRSVEMRRWVLYINGERLFAKGANLLPTTQLLGTASLSEVAGDIRAAHKPGLDLVRPVAHIARAEFYETADELGVLIWQHLPIRVVMSRSVVGEARREAREAVDLLGHHPSVAVWCAHDDPFPRTRRPSATPAAVSRLGPRGTATARPAVEQGAVPLRQLAPGGGPHRRAAALPVPGGHHEPAVVRPPRRAGRRSGPHAGRMPTMGQFVSAFGTPVSADQPEVVKMTIEDLRRLKYRPTGGFLLHALADVGAGPGRSESAAAGGFGVLDGLRRPKPGWQALVDACRPLVAAADPLPASVQGGDRLDLAVHVVNDTRSDMDEIPVRARVLGPGNIVISGQRWAGTATADDCVLVGRIDAGVPVGAGNSAVVVDVPRCGPMLGPCVPNLVPIPGVTGSADCAVRPLEGS